MIKKSGQWRTKADRTMAASIIHGIGPEVAEKFEDQIFPFFRQLVVAYFSNRAFASV